MSAILTTLLTITLYSGAILLVILLFRAAFRNRISPWLQYCAWFLFLLRLMMPVTLESGFHVESLFPARAEAAIVPAAQTETIVVDAGLTPVQSGDASAARPNVPRITLPAAEAAVSARKRADWNAILLTAWLSGMALTALWFVHSKQRFLHRLRQNAVYLDAAARTLFEDCRREAGCAAPVRLRVTRLAVSPMLLLERGQNVVVMPAAVLSDPAAARYAMLHELTHLKRGDHLMCLLLSALRCVYWFNPFVHAGFPEMQADMETACDAEVLRLLGRGEKRDYLITLLNLFTDRSQPLPAMAQAQTRRLAQKRMKGAFMKQKTGLITKMFASLLCAILLIACFTTACQPAPEKTAAALSNAAANETEPAAGIEAPAPTAVPAAPASAGATVTGGDEKSVIVTDEQGKAHTYQIVDLGAEEQSDTKAPRGDAVSVKEAAAAFAKELTTLFYDAVGDDTLYVSFHNYSDLKAELYTVYAGGKDWETAGFQGFVDALDGGVWSIEALRHQLSEGTRTEEEFFSFDWDAVNTEQVSAEVTDAAVALIEKYFANGRTVIFDAENLANGTFVDGIQLVSQKPYTLACDCKIRMDSGDCYTVQYLYPQMEISIFSTYRLGWDSCVMMDQHEEYVAAWQNGEEYNAYRKLSEEEAAILAEAAKAAVGKIKLELPEDEQNDYCYSWKLIDELLAQFDANDGYGGTVEELTGPDDEKLYPGVMLTLRIGDGGGASPIAVYVGDGQYVTGDTKTKTAVFGDLAADWGKKFTDAVYFELSVPNGTPGFNGAYVPVATAPVFTQPTPVPMTTTGTITVHGAVTPVPMHTPAP